MVPGDSFDCSKLLNRVEPIIQTRPDQRKRGKEKKENKREKKERKREKEKKEKKMKKRKREKKRKNEMIFNLPSIKDEEDENEEAVSLHRGNCLLLVQSRPFVNRYVYLRYEHLIFRSYKVQTEGYP